MFLTTLFGSRKIRRPPYRCSFRGHFKGRRVYKMAGEHDTDCGLQLDHHITRVVNLGLGRIQPISIAEESFHFV
jgi:hypothetical protein